MAYKVSMYSFKGGAGRTVTTANVARILSAERRKRVTVMDLDVESAGLSVLFGVDRKVESGECSTIQDVLRGFYAPESPGAPPDSIVAFATPLVSAHQWEMLASFMDEHQIEGATL